MSRLVHAGSAVVDYVYRIDALPLAGTEKTATSYHRVAGGGFNMMVAAHPHRHARRVRRPASAPAPMAILRAAFAAEGIETLTPPSPAMDTGNCVALVTGDAERTFVSWPGAEGVLTTDAFAHISPPPGDWVFTSGYTLSYPGSRDALGRLDRGDRRRIALRFRPDASRLGNTELSWLACSSVPPG